MDQISNSLRLNASNRPVRTLEMFIIYYVSSIDTRKL